MKRSDNNRFCWLLFLAGCTAPAEEATSVAELETVPECVMVQLPSSPPSQYCFPIAEPILSEDEACSPELQIGISPESGGNCPPILGSSWTEKKLFTGALPAELNRYCVYEWSDPLNDPDETVLPHWVDRDCAVVAPSGHEFEENNAAALETAFLAQVEHLLTLPKKNSMPTPTKVVIVDSAVDQGFPNPGTGELEHGEVMGRIVRDLGCPGGTACLAQVASSLGLPLTLDENGERIRDEENGGRFGSWGDLAKAILEGVRAAENAPGQDRIIVNLSVAWEPHWGGAYSNLTEWQDLRKGIRAVESAIAYANCRGAIVIAAAGNRSGGHSDAGGPAYPAGWNTKPSPDSIRCSNLSGVGTFPRPAGAAMVYAVGGVDGRDVPLSLTRPDGLPPMVAPAAHVGFITGIVTTRTWTGTSIAAAVASAAAAAAWTYLPNSSPHTIMEMVRANGILLSPQAEFCLPASCPFVRRISLCESVAAACRASTQYCKQEPACPELGEERDLRPTNLNFATPAPDWFEDASALTNEVYIPAPCEATIAIEGTVLPEHPCPDRQFLTRYGAPWTMTQPISIGCPSCMLDLFGTLHIGISDDVSPDAGLSDPTLAVKFFDQTTKNFPLPIPQDQLVPGATIDVDAVPVDVLQVEQAWLQFVMRDKTATSDEVLIEKQ